VGSDYLPVSDAFPALWVHVETCIAAFINRDELPFYHYVSSVSLQGQEFTNHPQSIYPDQFICNGGVSCFGD